MSDHEYSKSLGDLRQPSLIIENVESSSSSPVHEGRRPLRRQISTGLPSRPAQIPKSTQEEQGKELFKLQQQEHDNDNSPFIMSSSSPTSLLLPRVSAEKEDTVINKNELKKNAMDIEIIANPQHPSQYVDIRIKYNSTNMSQQQWHQQQTLPNKENNDKTTPIRNNIFPTTISSSSSALVEDAITEDDGLWAVLFMALAVEGWSVIEIRAGNTVTTKLPPATIGASITMTPRQPGNEGQPSAVTIITVVQIPQTTKRQQQEQSADVDVPKIKMKRLRLFFLSTCENYYLSPHHRSSLLKSLADAFVNLNDRKQVKDDKDRSNDRNEVESFFLSGSPSDHHDTTSTFHNNNNRIPDGSNRNSTTTTCGITTISIISPQQPQQENAPTSVANSVPYDAEVVSGTEERDLELNIRERVLQETTLARVRLAGNEDDDNNDIVGSERTMIKRRKQYNMLLSLLAVLLASALVGLAVGVSNRNDDRRYGSDYGDTLVPTISLAPSGSPTMTPRPTLETIRDRGYIRCCVNTKVTIGRLELGLCRALAAAIFGNIITTANNNNNINSTSNQQHFVDFISVPTADRFISLANRSIDVLIQNPTHTTSRSIQEANTGDGFAFSSPYFYDGLVFAGQSPEVVDCANRLDTWFGLICRSMTICILNASTHLDFLSNRIPSQNLEVVPTLDNVLSDGLCSVIGHESSQIMESLYRAVASSSDNNSNTSTTRLRYNEEGGESAALLEEEKAPQQQTNYSIGTNRFTREPLGMATRSDDYEWTLFVETVLQGLLEAEARNITQETATTFPSIPYFGPQYERMVVQAVDNVGNYAELYERTIGTELPRSGLNILRRDSCVDRGQQEGVGGLIYGFPFGSFLDFDPLQLESRSETTSSTIANILNRTEFRCGVPISQDIALFNVEICKAISAALFGSVDHFETVPFATDGSIDDWFGLLLDNNVDVLTGVGSTILPNVGIQMPKFFTSQPYFYYESSVIDDFGDMGVVLEASVLATRSKDHHWSMFVQWVVQSMIVAEEKSVSKKVGEFLPEVVLFGPRYDAMFRNIISNVGNYGEVYERTINTPPRRGGCNQLNTSPHGPQLYPYLFQGL